MNYLNRCLLYKKLRENRFSLPNRLNYIFTPFCDLFDALYRCKGVLQSWFLGVFKSNELLHWIGLNWGWKKWGWLSNLGQGFPRFGHFGQSELWFSAIDAICIFLDNFYFFGNVRSWNYNMLSIWSPKIMILGDQILLYLVISEQILAYIIISWHKITKKVKKIQKYTR